MRGNVLEAVIGAFVLVVAAFFMYFAYETSGEKLSKGYSVFAKFENSSGLSIGSDIRISGIKVGIIKSLKIDSDFQSLAEMHVNESVSIPSDSTASITTDGIMGNKYVSIEPGFEKEYLKPGEFFEKTRSSVSLESLIDKFLVGSKK